MPYSCIVRPYVDIKHTFYQQGNRKRLKFNIMYAVSNPLFYSISWPIAVAENRIWAGLKTSFCNLWSIGFLLMPYSCIVKA